MTTPARPEGPDDPRMAEFERLLDAFTDSAMGDENALPDENGRYPEDYFDERKAALLAWVRAHLPGEPVGYAVAAVGRHDDGYAFVVDVDTMTYETADEAKRAAAVAVWGEGAEVVALVPVPDGEP